MLVERARRAEIVYAPHFVEDPVARKHLAAVRCEERGELHLDFRERRGLPALFKPVVPHARRRAAELEVRRNRRHRRLSGAAQRGRNAREELAHSKRLRHVVVRSEFQPDNLVDLLAFRRQHQHRDAAPRRADLTADVVSALPGHHHVEDDEVERLRRALPGRNRRHAVRRGLHRVPLAREQVLQRLADVRVVFGNKYPLHRPPPNSSLNSAPPPSRSQQTRLPPMPSASRRAMESPRPLPDDFAASESSHL